MPFLMCRGLSSMTSFCSSAREMPKSPSGKSVKARPGSFLLKLKSTQSSAHTAHHYLSQAAWMAPYTWETHKMEKLCSLYRLIWRIVTRYNGTPHLKKFLHQWVAMGSWSCGTIHCLSLIFRVSGRTKYFLSEFRAKFYQWISTSMSSNVPLRLWTRQSRFGTWGTWQFQ